MSWRKRNFFRRRGKRESSLDLGKSTSVEVNIEFKGSVDEN